MDEYFDFIYIDGSHQAPDVLFDALLGFELLRVGGIMVFDDYLWQEPLEGGTDPIPCPKIFIDAFTNVYCKKVRVLPPSPTQLHIKKNPPLKATQGSNQYSNSSTRGYLPSTAYFILLSVFSKLIRGRR